nr:MAG TPA: hypothetical protein [Caudoviricetes sp.]
MPDKTTDELQIMLNKAIKKLSENWTVQPTFKTTEIQNGVKAEIFINSSNPISVGYANTNEKIYNATYTLAILEAIKNYDKTLVD